MSIKSEYADKILNGTKIYELRKKTFKKQNRYNCYLFKWEG